MSSRSVAVAIKLYHTRGPACSTTKKFGKKKQKYAKNIYKNYTWTHTTVKT